MPTLIRCIEGEIQPKGKAYLILEAYDPADFDRTLDAAMIQSQLLDAKEIFLAAKTEDFSFSKHAFKIADHLFVFETNFWLLRKGILGKRQSIPGGGLKFKKLADWNLELFLALYNACFFSVSNSKTYQKEDGERLLQDANRSAGFFMQGGAPLGIFELQQDGDTWEIASIAILEEYRGKGFGKLALKMLENRILDAGGTTCRVVCAESNRKAMGLYQALGYEKYQLLSSWYRYCPNDETY